MTTEQNPAGGAPGAATAPSPVGSTPADASAPVQLPPTIDFRTADPARVDANDWEARAAQVRAELAADDIAPSDLFEILALFRFQDDAGHTWSYPGETWFRWDGQQWVAGTPPGPMHMAISMDVAPEPAPEPALPDSSATPAPAPTHVTPPTVIPAWSSPDASIPPVTTLPPNLDVMVTDWLPTGWAHVVASNGWNGWLDGRQLRPCAAPAVGLAGRSGVAGPSPH